MTKSPVKMVSLGSGDPDNITLKAWNALKEADIIINPGKASTAIVGRLRGGKKLLEKCREVSMPMEENGKEALKRYFEITLMAFKHHMSGRRVAVTSIGDVGTYSTSSVIMVLLSLHGAEVDICPGVPYYTATAAASHSFLTQKEDSLLILSKVDDKNQLARYVLEDKMVVAVMKLSGNEEVVKEFLKETKCHFIYSEYLGDPKRELVFEGDLQRLLDRKFPYFSLIIIKP